MELSGAEERPPASRLLRSPAGLLGATLTALGLLLTADLAGGPNIRIGGLMVAVPALSAVFLWPYGVLVVSVLTIGCVVAASAENRTIDNTNFPVVMATTVLVGVASVMAATLRGRRERQLAQARRVAAVTQRALLRPLPPRLGRVTISSMYLAADEEAAIGGDLYAAAVTDRGATRVLVGDVQGKGLAAVEVAGLLLSAFRRAVRACTPLAALPGSLDASLREDLVDIAADGDPDGAPDLKLHRGARAEPGAEPGANPDSGTDPHPKPHLDPGPGADPGGDPAPDGDPGPVRHVSGGPAPPEARFLERFVTAVVVDIAADGGSVDIVNCGHPPPLLIHNDTVEMLLPTTPDLPLGLGDLTGQHEHVDTYGLEVGDILLLYTDGVIEARDREGTFYPLADRLAHWTADTPEGLLEALKADLLHFANTRLADDVAMVAVQRVI